MLHWCSRQKTTEETGQRSRCFACAVRHRAVILSLVQNGESGDAAAVVCLRSHTRAVTLSRRCRFYGARFPATTRLRYEVAVRATSSVAPLSRMARAIRHADATMQRRRPPPYFPLLSPRVERTAEEFVCGVWNEEEEWKERKERRGGGGREAQAQKSTLSKMQRRQSRIDSPSASLERSVQGPHAGRRTRLLEHGSASAR